MPKPKEYKYLSTKYDYTVLETLTDATRTRFNNAIQVFWAANDGVIPESYKNNLEVFFSSVTYRVALIYFFPEYRDELTDKITAHFTRLAMTSLSLAEFENNILFETYLASIYRNYIIDVAQKNAQLIPARLIQDVYLMGNADNVITDYQQSMMGRKELYLGTKAVFKPDCFVDLRKNLKVSMLHEHARKKDQHGRISKKSEKALSYSRYRSRNEIYKKVEFLDRTFTLLAMLFSLAGAAKLVPYGIWTGLFVLGLNRLFTHIRQSNSLEVSRIYNELTLENLKSIAEINLSNVSEKKSTPALPKLELNITSKFDISAFFVPNDNRAVPGRAYLTEIKDMGTATLNPTPKPGNLVPTKKPKSDIDAGPGNSYCRLNIPGMLAHINDEKILSLIPGEESYKKSILKKFKDKIEQSRSLDSLSDSETKDKKSQYYGCDSKLRLRRQDERLAFIKRFPTLEEQEKYDIDEKASVHSPRTFAGH